MKGISTTERQVREAVASTLDVRPEAIEADVPLTDYGMDSLRIVELIVELEASIGITFPDEVLVAGTFESVSKISATLQQIERLNSDPGR